MTKKETAKAKKTYDQRNHDLMVSLWGEELESIPRWSRIRNNGFATFPRWLPIINRIMDKLSQGKPMSSTYLSLWFRVNDEGFIHIKDENQMAIESGFDSERKTSTWKTRMRELEKFGFIVSRKGVKGEFEYILIVNPSCAIEKLKNLEEYNNLPHSIKDTISQYEINLKERMTEVGA
ncbi:TPA: hypothetical protein QB365_002117 [Pasteurella multocida]|uniref:hypothetical protein n=1 Tax=Pasteurella multocida TaxID=747 RepID=UPI0013981C80|nr:hypothetical protein [Pasteurella multocida]MCL7802576.1 hypothetical protein [Pasteurella multocida]MDH3003028.1 hypothetical protein [Pasteurella multocida]QHZ98722.1 hypothetical protein GV127_10595 [Pasteurella multocida]URH97336.1 hypothetical protein M8855_10700 [Pasteurella multocida]HDR1014179.1 hypothetical protein [Pasteurella multocida]